MKKLLERCSHLTEDCDHTWFRGEEIASSITHLIGALLGVAALVLLVVFADIRGHAATVVGCAIFGVSLILTYSSSAIYHAVKSAAAKKLFRTFDHISIYLLIAGSYTPITLVALPGALGWSLFGVIWGLAIAGTIFKWFYTDKVAWLSTLIYVLMGWMVVFAAAPVMHALPTGCLLWLLAGGLAYTFGVIFFVLETVPYAHAIWHLFVLAGSICHFFAIFLYIVPMK